VKNLTWQNPEQLIVAQELIIKVKTLSCGIKEKINFTLHPSQVRHKILYFRMLYV